MKTIIKHAISFTIGAVVGGALTFGLMNHSTTEESVDNCYPSTNTQERVSQPDWFKENNNYIWDGWKLK